MKLKELKKALTEHIMETKGTGDQWAICGRYGYIYNPYLEYVAIYEVIEVNGDIQFEEHFFNYYQLKEIGFNNFLSNSDKTRFNKIRKLFNELYY